MFQLGPGGKALLFLLGLGILGYTADRYVGRARLLKVAGLREDTPPPPPPPLSTGDFPAGAAAPVGDLAALPLRPVRLAARPRGSSAVALVAAGGVGLHKETSPIARGYNLELELTLLPDEESIVQGLLSGGERDGFDAAIVSADRLPALRVSARDAKLKAVMLVAWSRGADAVVAVPPIEQTAQLRGHRIATSPAPSRFLLMWSLAQAGLSFTDLQEVQVRSPTEAANLLREGKVEAAAGIAGELAAPLKEKGGRVLATTADAPYLVPEVLVVRSELLARYPDAARRLVRGLLDAQEMVQKDATEGARLLTTAAPFLDNPTEAIRADVPATLAENFAFFGLKGNAPVHFDEVYESAAALWKRLGEKADGGPSADAREMGPLLSTPPVTTAATP